jgi:hypothetical protein
MTGETKKPQPHIPMTRLIIRLSSASLPLQSSETNVLITVMIPLEHPKEKRIRRAIGKDVDNPKRAEKKLLSSKERHRQKTRPCWSAARPQTIDMKALPTMKELAIRPAYFPALSSSTDTRNATAMNPE